MSGSHRGWKACLDMGMLGSHAKDSLQDQSTYCLKSLPYDFRLDLMPMDHGILDFLNNGNQGSHIHQREQPCTAVIMEHGQGFHGAKDPGLCGDLALKGF